MRLTGLWRHAEFRKLWAGQATSLVGSQMVGLALPLTAVIVLDASPLQMGAITAVSALPALFFGLHLGVWTDRRKRRPILVAADIGRALLLLSIPIAHQFDALTIELLYAVAIGMGAMSLLFEIAYRSFLPAVISRDQLVEGNSKLEMAKSGAAVAGPSISGVLIQAISAPFVMLFGAAAFAISAVIYGLLRVNEPDPTPATSPDGQVQTAMAGIAEGLRFIRGNRTLVGIAGSQAILNLFNAAIEAIAILYMVRELGLSPGLLGITFAAGSVGLFIGAVAASRLTSRIGIGPVITLGILIAAASDLILPLIGGPTPLVVVALASGEVLLATGFVLYNVGQVSLRQAVTPDRLLGRMNAIMIVMARSAIPAGALLGGILGQLIGLREALIIAVIGEAAAVLWLLYFRIWTVRSIPAAVTG